MRPDQLQALAVKALEQIKKNTANQLSEAKLELVRFKAKTTRSRRLQLNIQVQHAYTDTTAVGPTAPKPETNSHPIAHQAVDLSQIQEIPNSLPEALYHQLKALGMKHIQQQALDEIIQNPAYFTDGLVLNHLPPDFSCETHQGQQVLAYTSKSGRLPSALMPKIELQAATDGPPAKTKQNVIDELPPQLPPILDKTELIKKIKACEDSLIPVLSQVMTLGGPAYGMLFLTHLETLKKKSLSLAFLTRLNPAKTFDDFKSMRYLDKLTRLKESERRWWDKLVSDHLKHNPGNFDFNSYFEVYTMVFLPKLAELGVNLPLNPPKQPVRHMLTGLARMTEIIEKAADKAAQCESLSDLDFSPLGAHHAMTTRQFKQVTADMKLGEQSPPPVKNPLSHLQEQTQATTTAEQASLTDAIRLWCHRYAGQHWNPNISVSDLNTKIHKLPYPEQDKRILLYILTLAAYTHDDPSLCTEDLLKSVDEISKAMHSLTAEERKDLLVRLSQCADFKQIPTLQSLTQLVTRLMHLKTQDPDRTFIPHIVDPIQSCLTAYGETLLSNLWLRTPTFLNTLTQALHELKDTTIQPSLDFALTLSCVQADALLTTEVSSLQQKFETLLPQARREALLATLAQINIQLTLQKGKSLPTLAQIENLIETLPAEAIDEASITAFINAQNPPLLGGCIIGSGELKAPEASLGAVIKDFFAQYNYDIANGLDTYIKKCIAVVNSGATAQKKAYEQAKLTPIIELFKTLETYLKEHDKVDLDQVYPKLSQLEAALNDFLECSLVVATGAEILHYIVQKKGGIILRNFLGKVAEKVDSDHPKDSKTGRLMDAFEKSESHSLSVLFKEDIISRLKAKLQSTLNQLELPALNESILNEVEQLDTSKPASKGLPEYDARIKVIDTFLRTLIDTKNMDETHFHGHMTALMQSPLKHLSPGRKSKLFEQLNKAHLHFPLSQSLPLLINLLCQDLPDFSINLSKEERKEQQKEQDAWFIKVDRALEKLDPLLTLLPTLGDNLNLKTTLFNMSVAHNFRSERAFPLDEIITLQQLAFGNKEQILTALMVVLKKLSPQTDPNLLNTLLSTTTQLLSDRPNDPILTQLIASLLEQIQPLYAKPSATELAKDLESYNKILKEVARTPVPKDAPKFLNILNKLASSNRINLNLSTLANIQEELQHRDNLLKLPSIIKLFETEPYPQAESLYSILQQHDAPDALEKYCASFDLNPLSKEGNPRAPEVDLTIDNLEKILPAIQDLDHKKTLSPEEQLSLAKQLVYLTSLGEKLTTSTRVDLKTQAETLRDELRKLYLDPQADESIKIQKELQLLAVLRESYFRTSENKNGGIFPNISQMLSLLISLRYPGNLLMQIRTGEGKSVTSPILAALQWMRVEGAQVDLLTADMLLLKDGYTTYYERFFKFLGIKSTIVKKDSPKETYIKGGINCSDPENMIGYRQTAERRRESLSKDNTPTHVIIDECDDVLFSGSTCSLVSQSSSKNPYAWVYPHVHSFIQQAAYLRTKGDGVWTQADDIDQLRVYLKEKAGDNNTQQTSLAQAEDWQLEQWLVMACKAEQCELDQHFILQPGDEINDRVTVGLKQSCIPKPGCSFDEQNALQARLEAEARRNEKDEHFKISPNPRIISIQSVRDLMLFYQESGGRLLGISGTPGDLTELQSLAALYGTQAMSLPQNKGQTRIDLPSEFTHNKTQTTEAIKRVITSVQQEVKEFVFSDYPDRPGAATTYLEREREARKVHKDSQTQPILIIVESPKEARELQKALEKEVLDPLSFEFAKQTAELGRPPMSFKLKGLRVQLITGEEDSTERQRRINLAGEHNIITISTKTLGRGVDIDPGTHKDGLRVIHTYVDIERDTDQVKGRSGRNNKPGTYQFVGQVDGAPKNWIKKILYSIFPPYTKYRDQLAFNRRQEQLTHEENLKRSYGQAVNFAQSNMMKLFDEWETLLKELNPTLATRLMELRADLLYTSQRLQKEEDPEKKVPEANESAKEILKRSIENVQTALCEYWENFQKDILVNDLLATEQKKDVVLSFESQIRLNYLQTTSLKNELQVQMKIEQHSQTMKKATTASVQQQLRFVLKDKAGARLTFDPTVTEAEKKTLELQQACEILPWLIEHLSELQPMLYTEFPRPRPQLTSTEDIQDLLKTLTQAIPHLDLHQRNLSKRFQTQNLIRSIRTISEKFLGADNPTLASLNALDNDYTKDLMKTVAKHLLDQLKWIEEPQPLHAKLERAAVRDAAKRLHAAAKALRDSPHPTPADAQALYQTLQQARLDLKGLIIVSLGHKNTRDLVQETLTAMDALHHMPEFENKSRAQIHDDVLVQHHLQAFEAVLAAQAPKTASPLWSHLETKINLLKTEMNGQTEYSHLIELRELLNRFSGYEAYKTQFKKPIQALLTQLDKTIAKLKKTLSSADKISENIAFMERRSSKLKTRLKAKNLSVQARHNGIEPYIEAHFEGNQQSDPNAIGYTAHTLAALEEQQVAPVVEDPKLSLWNTLLNLDWATCVAEPAEVDTLPEADLKQQIQKIFWLKSQPWNQGTAYVFDSLEEKTCFETAKKTHDEWQAKQNTAHAELITLRNKEAELNAAKRQELSTAYEKDLLELEKAFKKIGVTEGLEAAKAGLLTKFEQTVADRSLMPIDKYDAEKEQAFKTALANQSTFGHAGEKERLKTRLAVLEKLKIIQDCQSKMDEQATLLANPKTLAQLTSDSKTALEALLKQHQAAAENRVAQEKAVLDRAVKRETRKSNYQVLRFFDNPKTGENHYAELLRWENQAEETSEIEKTTTGITAVLG